MPGAPEEELDNGDMVGVVKIKDGLFICDEYGAQVRTLILTRLAGP